MPLGRLPVSSTSTTGQNRYCGSFGELCAERYAAIPLLHRAELGEAVEPHQCLVEDVVPDVHPPPRSAIAAWKRWQAGPDRRGGHAAPPP